MYNNFYLLCLANSQCSWTWLSVATPAIKIINKHNVIATYRFKLQTVYKQQAMIISYIDLYNDLRLLLKSLTSMCNVRLLDHFQVTNYLQDLLHLMFEKWSGQTNFIWNIVWQDKFCLTKDAWFCIVYLHFKKQPNNNLITFVCEAIFTQYAASVYK